VDSASTNVVKSSSVVSTCGEIRSTGPVISSGARSIPAAVVTIWRCSISQADFGSGKGHDQ
jgi:hypothetical protein